MPANVDAMVREGVNAFKAGNKEDARALLMKAAEVDPYSEQAWLWLSAVVDSPEDQRTCLENVLAINPDNERARNGLTILNQPGATPSIMGGGQDTDSNGGVDWDMSIPTSSASAQQSAPDISDDEYDNWLANLNLPSPSGASPTSAANVASSPFGDVNIFDDDVFSGGPFSADEMEDVFTPPATPSRPAPAPAAPASPPTPAPAAPAPQQAKFSPGRENPVFAGSASTVGFSDDVDEEVGGLFAEFDADISDEDLAELNADELFSYIPAEIKATRLPGTRERQPFVLTLLTVLLVLLNIGAVALLVYRLLPNFT